MAKKPFPWLTLRKVVQGLTFTGWLVLFIGTASLALPAGWSRLPIDLDPLLVLAGLISGHALHASLLLGLLLVLLTLVFGRAWCGWACPVGTVLDMFPFHKKTSIRKPVPEILRKGKFLLAGIILLAAVFANLSLLILDPMTLWTRTLAGGVIPAFNTAFTGLSGFLVRFDWLSAPVQWLDQLARPLLLPLEPVGTRLVWLPLALFTSIILLNLAAERFWCRYLCPLGGLLGWLSKIALVKRSVDSKCTQCGKCTNTCPTGTINPARDFASDPGECTLCMNCLVACPGNKTSFRPSLSLPVKQSYDPDRRDFLVSGAVTLTGLAVLGTEKLDRDAPTTLLRPPGVDFTEFLQQCIRCGLCVRACPTGALQPSILESGLSGVFSPVLVPRLGYCLFSCNDCGQVCPTQAIPPLALKDKQTQVIGHAFIDQNRCIPWADGATCIVCEEMCPLPDKAITLEVKLISQADGTTREIKLPHVHRDLCIGCGICEFKCPRSGESAIRVYRVDYT